MKPATQIVMLLLLAAWLIAAGHWRRHQASEAESVATGLNDLLSPASPGESGRGDLGAPFAAELRTESKLIHLDSMVSFVTAAALILWAAVTACRSLSGEELPKDHNAKGVALHPETGGVTQSIFHGVHPAVFVMFGLCVVACPVLIWNELIHTYFVLLGIVMVVSRAYFKLGKKG